MDERIDRALAITPSSSPLHRAYISQPVQPLEEWMTGSPLMQVTFQQD
ncbi:hypothetical protein AAE021_07545 [Arthrobacter citreus]|uniref:Uncharacterized protein n=1 Tax=Arthrobacter citreus TaxID=1670 RepID=A0ABZ3A103_9MICC